MTPGQAVEKMQMLSTILSALDHKSQEQPILPASRPRALMCLTALRTCAQASAGPTGIKSKHVAGRQQAAGSQESTETISPRPLGLEG